MYVFPHSLKTWLMGDALYMDPSGSGYYMGTDVGYLRMIFYFGLPATIYFVIMLWRYYKILADLTTQKALKYVFGILIIATVVINIKVINFFSEYFVLFLVFLVLPKYSSALKDIKKNL